MKPTGRGALAARGRSPSSAIACFLVVIVLVVIIWAHARKARGASCAASPIVFRKLRERTKRSLERNPLGWIVTHVFGGDDLIRCVLLFDPLIEGRENVV